MNPSPTDTTEALARTYIEAVGQKRLDDVADVLHDDLEFTTRGLSFTKTELLMAFERLGRILSHNEITQIVVGEDEVCVVYDFVTDTVAGVVPSVETLTIEDGRIRTIHLTFEFARWPEVMAEIARRSTVTA